MNKSITQDDILDSLVILGANGFVGKAIMLRISPFIPIKAVARSIPPDHLHISPHITWYSADLLVPGSLTTILGKDDVVINLAYMRTADKDDNVRMIQHIIDSCLKNKVKKLIHCSTAVVVGTVKNARIDETTPCVPSTAYELNKFAVEQCVIAAGQKGLHVSILRPTAIVGPGGKNLLKLSNSLLNGNKVINYLRASLFSSRKMHLVPVGTVADSLLYIAMQDNLPNGEIYFISADDDPENNFLNIEKILRSALGLRPRKMPLLPLPLGLLSFLLKVMGRSELNLARTYDSSKLHSINFSSVHTVCDTVTEFGKSLLKNKSKNEEVI